MAMSRRNQATSVAAVFVAFGLVAGATLARAQPVSGSGPGSATPATRVRGVRSGVHDGAQLLADASRACPFLQRLIDVLELSDVVVFVELRDDLPNGRAQLTFVASRAGVRWLRISIAAGLMWRQQAAFLAHELQHAVEVARAPEVQDVDGLRRLYERIGYPVGPGRFETTAAVAAENQALRDLTEKAPRRGPREGRGRSGRRSGLSEWAPPCSAARTSSERR